MDIDAEDLKQKMGEVIDAAINAGRDMERKRLTEALAGLTTDEPVTGTARYKNGGFTAALRGPRKSKFLEAPVTRARRLGRNGVGKRALEARSAYVSALPPGSIVRSKDLAKLPPKVSSYTDHQVMAKLVEEKLISPTPTRGSYVKN